ncbi:MAG: hypothetical protein Q8N52_09965, partial [Acidobacteriota bacterium]|nr:hypothetical protein [Acidobacteriota bacterium]
MMLPQRFRAERLDGGERSRVGDAGAPAGYNGRTPEAGGDYNGLRCRVEFEWEHPAGQRLAALTQFLVQAAPVGFGQEAAGPVGPPADALVTAPAGNRFERIIAAAFVRAEVEAKPLRDVLFLVRGDFGGRDQDFPSPAAARAARAGEALLRIDPQGNRQREGSGGLLAPGRRR